MSWWQRAQVSDPMRAFTANPYFAMSASSAAWAGRSALVSRRCGRNAPVIDARARRSEDALGVGAPDPVIGEVVLERIDALRGPRDHRLRLGRRRRKRGVVRAEHHPEQLTGTSAAFPTAFHEGRKCATSRCDRYPSGARIASTW